MEKPGDRSGTYVPAQKRSIEDLQAAKLFVSRIHRVAAQVASLNASTLKERTTITDALYEIAFDLEERYDK